MCIAVLATGGLFSSGFCFGGHCGEGRYIRRNKDITWVRGKQLIWRGVVRGRVGIKNKKLKEKKKTWERISTFIKILKKT